MREVLYRGKRIDNGEWIEAEAYNHYKGNGIWADSPKKEIYFVGGFACMDKTVTEFTGITDKNGKKIFDGDVVSFCYGHNKDICEVCFENGAFGLGKSYPKKFDYDELEMSVVNATGNDSHFVGNDNFISLWEIAWNYNEYAGENLHLVEIIGNKFDKEI